MKANTFPQHWLRFSDGLGQMVQPSLDATAAIKPVAGSAFDISSRWGCLRIQPRPNALGRKAVGDEEALACFIPVWTFTLPSYGKFAFTDDKVLLTLPPRPFSTKIATTAMRARISAYSTKLWPFRDFSPRYIFRRVLFISFTSFIWLFRIAQRSNILTFIQTETVAAYVPPSPDWTA